MAVFCNSTFEIIQNGNLSSLQVYLGFTEEEAREKLDSQHISFRKEERWLIAENQYFSKEMPSSKIKFFINVYSLVVSFSVFGDKMTREEQEVAYMNICEFLEMCSFNKQKDTFSNCFDKEARYANNLCQVDVIKGVDHLGEILENPNRFTILIKVDNILSSTDLSFDAKMQFLRASAPKINNNKKNQNKRPTLLDYILKSKRQLKEERINNALLNGAIVNISFDKKEDFVSKYENSWWLHKLPWITVLACIVALSISDIILSRFHMLNIAAYVGMGLMAAMYLWIFFYFVYLKLFSNPERYHWLIYSIFWLLIGILVWFSREKILFSDKKANQINKLVEEPANAVGRVYICTGPQAKSYHKNKECYGLQSCSADVAEITLDEAEDQGRHPCRYCCKDNKRKNLSDYAIKNRRKLYENLTREGFDLGTIEDFNMNIDNKETRKQIYNAAYQSGWELPSYDQFEKDMGV